MYSRREHYVGCTLAVDEALQDSWAPAIFQMAVTNGLLAIAEVELPDLMGKASSRWTPPASTVAKELQHKFGTPVSPTVEIPGAEGCPTTVMCNQLLEAIDVTNTVRHGKPAKRALTRKDLEALVALDDHHALRGLKEARELSAREELEESLRTYDAYEEAADSLEWSRAADYCALLDDAELERRAGAIPQNHDPDDASPEPSECPVCLNTSVISTGLDGYGNGITIGTCSVCSYTRSAYAARQENLRLEAERHLARD